MFDYANVYALFVCWLACAPPPHHSLEDHKLIPHIHTVYERDIKEERWDSVLWLKNMHLTMQHAVTSVCFFTSTDNEHTTLTNRNA